MVSLAGCSRFVRPTSGGPVQTVDAQVAAVQGLSPYAILRAIARFQERILVLGQDANEPIVVVSTDDGRNWQAYRPQGVATTAVMVGLRAFRDRVVAVGWDRLQGRSLPRIWTSTDGQSWTVATIAMPQVGMFSAELFGVTSITTDVLFQAGAANPPIGATETFTLIAVGRQRLAESATPFVVRATGSFDNWAPVASNQFGDGRMISVATDGTAAGVVAVGSRSKVSGTAGAIWTSQDGMTWSVVRDERILNADAGVAFTDIARGRDGLMVVGIDTVERQRHQLAPIWQRNQEGVWSRQPNRRAAFSLSVGAENTLLPALAFVSDDGFWLGGEDWLGEPALFRSRTALERQLAASHAAWAMENYGGVPLPAPEWERVVHPHLDDPTHPHALLTGAAWTPSGEAAVVIGFSYPITSPIVIRVALQPIDPGH